MGPGLVLESSDGAYSMAAADLLVLLTDPIFTDTNGGEKLSFETTCSLNGGRCESIETNGAHNPDLTDASISFSGFTLLVTNTLDEDLVVDRLSFNLIAGGEINLTGGATGVEIDVLPGSFRNMLDLSDDAVLPFAILGAPDFDAFQVIEDSILLANAPVKRTAWGFPSGGLSCRESDVNDDGLSDLLCEVRTSNLDVETGQGQVTLTAELAGGGQIQACDQINVVP